MRERANLPWELKYSRSRVVAGRRHQPGTSCCSRGCGGVRGSLSQLWDRLSALGDNRLGATLEVSPLGVKRYGQVSEDGRTEVGGGHAGVLHVGPLGVRAADHLATG